MVVDNKIAYIGGLNIRDYHTRKYCAGNYVEDTHFRLEGPICSQLSYLFLEDWEFSKGDFFKPEAIRWPPATDPIFCRVVSDGPDIDFDKLRWILLGAISEAQREIKIITPYFLPDASITEQLKVAALKGVDVKIIIPKKSNIPFFSWAQMPQLLPLVKAGCKVFLNAHFFDHSKILSVDGEWAFIGSANWDSRSLRLNFEANLEVYHEPFCRQLNELFDEKLKAGTLVSEKDLKVSRLEDLRNNLFRLLAPYL